MPEFVQRLPRIRSAVAYAECAHAGQPCLADGAPFILHPLEVATLLYDAGARDHVIAAGVLHDTLEKTDATSADLAARFGPRITALVAAVTEDKSIKSYSARKAGLRDQVARANDDAALVFAADKVSKTRELRRAGPTAMPVRRRRLPHYKRCLALLEERLPGAPLVRSLKVEVDFLVAASKPAGALSSSR